MQAEIDYWRKGEVGRARSGRRGIVRRARPRSSRPAATSRSRWDAGTVDLPKAAAEARSALELLDPLPARRRTGPRRGCSGPPEFEPTSSSARALTLEAAEARARARLARHSGRACGHTRSVQAEPVAAIRRRPRRRPRKARPRPAARAAVDEGDEASLANILLNRRRPRDVGRRGGARQRELTGRMKDAFEQLGTKTPAASHRGSYTSTRTPDRLEPVEAPSQLSAPCWVSRSWLLILERCPRPRRACRRRPRGRGPRPLGRAGGSSTGSVFHEPAIWRVDGDAIEAAVGVGDLQRGETPPSRFEERAARSRIPWSLAAPARCRGLMLAALGDLEGAADVLVRALAEHKSSPVPFERARTLLFQGQVPRGTEAQA